MSWLSKVGNWIEGEVSQAAHWVADEAAQAWTWLKHELIPDMRRDREAQIQSAANARNIVYGRSRVGNQIAYVESAGGGNSILHLICIHAGHEIDGYEEIYFGDNLVAQSTASTVGGVAYAAWDIHAPYTGKAAIEYFDGSQTTASASMVAASAGNSPAGGWDASHLLLGVAYTHVQLTYDQSVYPAGVPVVKAVIRGKKVLDTRTGVIAWSSNPAMCIRDYLLIPHEQGGCGCAADEIDEAAIVDAANVCDQQVSSMIPLDAGFTPVRHGGKAVHPAVSSSLETRYTLNGEVRLDGVPTDIIKSMLTAMAGEAVYSEGQWKIFAGAPSASVATIDESWLNGGISFQSGSNKSSMNNTVTGNFTNSNDYWADTQFPPVPVGISTPPNTTYWTKTATPLRYDPSQTYAQNAYVTWAGLVYRAFPSGGVPLPSVALALDNAPPNSTYWVLVEVHDNSLQYPNAYVVQRGGSVYTSMATVPVSNPYLAQDGGEVLAASITLPFTIGSSEAQRLAKIVLLKSRFGFAMTMPCNHKAFGLEVMDVVTVNNSLLGMTGKLFRVIGWEFSMLGGVNLSLIEYDPSIYDWSASDSSAYVSPVITNFPDPWTVPVPTGLTVTESLYAGNVPSVVKTQAVVSWTSGGASSQYFDVYLDGIMYVAGVTGTSFTIPDMTPGSHTFGVRATNATGAHSAIVLTTNTIHGKTTPPADVVGFTGAFSGNLVHLAWTPNTETDLSGYEIRIGASWAAGTVSSAALSGSYRPSGAGTLTHWIKAINTTGVYSTNAVSVAATIPAAAAPTAIVTTGTPQGIDIAVTYPATQDIDYCEIFASTSNDISYSVSVGITRNGKFAHQGLGNGARRYYWARTRNVFGEYSALYPAGATAGIVGDTVDPVLAIQLLNASVSSADANAYLTGSKALLGILDTKAVAYGAGTATYTSAIASTASAITGPAAFVPGVFTSGVFIESPADVVALEQRVSSARIDIDSANAAITLRATKDDLSGEVVVLSDMIGLKLNASGTVGPGLAIGWTDSTRTKSNITILADTLNFESYDSRLPSGHQLKQLLSIGQINGSYNLGFSGNVIIDGSINARSLVADSAMVTFLNAQSIVAGSVDAVNISGTTITGKTVQTASGTVKKMLLNGTTNEAEFWGDRGDGTIELLANIGIKTSGSDTIIGNFGSSSSTSGLMAINASSGTGTAIKGFSSSATAFLGWTGSGYGCRLKVDGLSDGYHLYMMAGNRSGAPTQNTYAGTFYVNSAGELYYNRSNPSPGTNWVKIA